MTTATRAALGCPPCTTHASHALPKLWHTSQKPPSGLHGPPDAAEESVDCYADGFRLLLHDQVGSAPQHGELGILKLCRQALRTGWLCGTTHPLTLCSCMVTMAWISSHAPHCTTYAQYWKYACLQARLPRRQ